MFLAGQSDDRDKVIFTHLLELCEICLSGLNDVVVDVQVLNLQVLGTLAELDYLLSGFNCNRL